MSLLGALFGHKSNETVFDPTPDVVRKMPARPYLVLQADLPFYSDPECKVEVKGARLVVLRSEDPKQQHHPVECMPTRKIYTKGQILRWEINHKLQWEEAWYHDPDSGTIQRAWSRAVEFLGKVVEA